MLIWDDDVDRNLDAIVRCRWLMWEVGLQRPKHDQDSSYHHISREDSQQKSTLCCDADRCDVSGCRDPRNLFQTWGSILALRFHFLTRDQVVYHFLFTRTKIPHFLSLSLLPWLFALLTRLLLVATLPTRILWSILILSLHTIWLLESAPSLWLALTRPTDSHTIWRRCPWIPSDMLMLLATHHHTASHPKRPRLPTLAHLLLQPCLSPTTTHPLLLQSKQPSP